MNNVFEQEEQYKIAPFVLVIDCSPSMREVMSEVNRFVPNLIATMQAIPAALESAALGVVTFAETAKTVRRLKWIDAEETQTRFEVFEHRTSYAAPLKRVRELIKQDVGKLGSYGFRPVVFFITDAKPNVEKTIAWKEERRKLVNMSCEPKILALGFGSVDFETLSSLASEPGLAKMADSATGVAAMQEILRVIMNTVVVLTSGGEAHTDSFADKVLRAGQPLDGHEDTVPYED